jgi:hypothetical protein
LSKASDAGNELAVAGGLGILLYSVDVGTARQTATGEC